MNMTIKSRRLLFIGTVVLSAFFAVCVFAANEVDLSWQYSSGSLAGEVPEGGLIPNSNVVLTAVFLEDVNTACSGPMGYKLYRTIAHAIGGNLNNIEYKAKGTAYDSPAFSYSFNSGTEGQKNVYWAIFYCWSSSSPETALSTAKNWRSLRFDQTTIKNTTSPSTSNVPTSNNSTDNQTDVSGGNPTSDGTGSLPGRDLTIQNLADLVTRIACYIIQMILAVMVIALIVAGIRFFLARGVPAKFDEARKNFTWVLIGIAIILATNFIIATIANFIGGSYQYLPLDCSGTSVTTNTTTFCGEGNTCAEGFYCAPCNASPNGCCVRE